MAAVCFCGCGRKVKLPRRAFNSTGNLVDVQLGAWEESRELLEGVGLWRGDVERFVATGEEMRADLLNISHGGRVMLRHTQRQMTQWLLRSRELLVQLDAGDTAAIAAGLGGEEPAGLEPDERPEPLPADARAARRAEIEAIRQSYESDAADNTCPDCGASFEDQGSYLAHVAAQHG
jgi:hypothetical protein